MPNYIVPLSVSSTGTAGDIVASGTFPFSPALCSTVIVVNPSTSDLTISPGSGNALSITARAGSVTVARWVSSTLNTFEVTQVSATTASAAGSLEFTDDVLPPSTTYIGTPTVVVDSGSVTIDGTPTVVVDSGSVTVTTGSITIDNATDNAANTQPGQGSYDTAALPSSTFSDAQSWDLGAGETTTLVFTQDVLSSGNSMKGIQLQLYDVSFLGLGGAPEYATCALTYILLYNGSQAIGALNVQEVATSSSPSTLPNVFSFNINLLDGVANNGLSVEILYYLTSPTYTWSGSYTQTATIGGVVIESSETPPAIVGVVK